MIYFSDTHNPYENLSMEELLLRAYAGEPTLYLWINAPSVILGRNQNAWRECRVDALKDAGVLLVRRDSGGGAVYHDLGNLLFSLILPPTTNLDLSYSLLIDALSLLGIEAMRQGRNDISVVGRKVSGSAYRHTDKALLHHGTLLVNTDLTRLSNYLNPSPLKLSAKGVSSARARVANLTEFQPELTVEQVQQALARSFSDVFSQDTNQMLSAREAVSPQELSELSARKADWQFVYGATPPFDVTIEGRLSFGDMILCMGFEQGHVARVKIYTDALDIALPSRLESRLLGAPMERGALTAAVFSESAEVSQWLSENLSAS